MGLVSSKEKFEHDIKDTLEELHEPVISATLPEMPKYSLRLVDMFLLNWKKKSRRSISIIV